MCRCDANERKVVKAGYTNYSGVRPDRGDPSIGRAIDALRHTGKDPVIPCGTFLAGKTDNAVLADIDMQRALNIR